MISVKGWLLSLDFNSFLKFPLFPVTGFGMENFGLLRGNMVVRAF